MLSISANAVFVAKAPVIHVFVASAEGTIPTFAHDKLWWVELTEILNACREVTWKLTRADLCIRPASPKTALLRHTESFASA